ncbi:HNH endonuclease [Actinoplanes palleronii]|uniref:HNH nuclease domain-containing protein n=1 Tax=Actinoplanes palleronii TaxID=113570 RepID=A0ABQ4BJ88_9ACTN|nr:HNH endonuclease signature motif containing protein [Actinoplanes palleronii]GIE70747.1 hypothetical protein Apa02nite_068550 [Actinoplanes palleronii]
MPQRTCGTAGCPNAHRAKGLCSSCYNRKYLPAERHRKSAVKCSHCGGETLKHASSRYAERFCSYACRDARRIREAVERRLPVLFVGLIIRPQPSRPEQPRSTKRWVAGNCHRCGKAYVAEDYTDTARFCSTTCQRRVSKQRYRARKKQAYIADVSPRRIYERDGWRCQLCRKPVRRDLVAPASLAPVIDHVVPLAQGGTHEPANVQCAHFLCNSVKSDRMEPVVQLALM